VKTATSGWIKKKQQSERSLDLVDLQCLN